MSVNIETLEIIRENGKVISRGYKRVIEWAKLYKEELALAWNDLSQGILPNRIPPLPGG